MDQSKIFQTAVRKAKSGDRPEARTLLLKLVETNPRHEMAWLWLSELVQDPEDKIIALENALHINPERSQAQKKLKELQQKYDFSSNAPESHFSLNGQQIAPTTQEVQFHEIELVFINGNPSVGRKKLAKFLHRYGDHEAGWWLLVQNADSETNLLIGLEHLLRLNKSHPKAPDILETIKPGKENALRVGRLYERLEAWETAVRCYKLALKSPNNADRLLAKKHLPRVEEQVRLDNIKVTSPTATVVRLAVGPTLLYFMLVLVQAGLQPLQLSPLLCLANLIFLGGLLLSGTLKYAPEHAWLEKLPGTAVLQNKLLLRLIGLGLILLPAIILLLMTLSRLLAFEFDLDSVL